MAIIKRALISVSDKSGLGEFASGLVRHGVEILSTGGTAKALQQLGIPVKDVAAFTGFPEMLDGRVKTLHPKIHGGLLAVRDNPAHQAQMAAHDIQPIDMVVVNLYPFEATVARSDCTLEEAIENIDIGGPSMLRSAAKNYRSVTVIVDPRDYSVVLAEMDAHAGVVSIERNAALARTCFARTAAYDGAISNWLSSLDDEGMPQLFPATLTMQFHKRQSMRYGENPHQLAAFYTEPGPIARPSLARADQLQGKELSFNNIHDANGALELVHEFQDPTVVIVKHANPCGVASSDNLLTAYQQARDCDRTSAFGGIIACNRPVSKELAQEMTAMFVEAVIAPSFEEEALALFASKKNVRLLATQTAARSTAPGRVAPEWTMMEMKRVLGGLLVQERDTLLLRKNELRVVSARHPSDAELRDLEFAWKVVKYVKSNAIVYARNHCTVGVGAGQMSRVDASRIAVWKAGEAARSLGIAIPPGGAVAGSVLASDAFFPFRDGIDAAAEAGATAVIQPGGSVRDEEVIEAANAHNMAMLFTGVRHFRH
ncbi:bifunctional phosphoribosylaminoimidazolecarboxamide formyltransferase/IMP cyclohydrolase [Candidatus Magnetaquicoccus inordinatus]|uniref:bifunctional phosphoribosylaminoimidazolecarboxamide formyltransferase/IMP cyclohydrolase n=1 Tax=Candidatus Magnetaquicoccus inordinatus TaxID=2496818 RepID=UPI00102B4393|nr:bifunctional phosphoribosylaminoimidazolecarboxamide formyltransferase/IMP cyclohydrolase [Candidatus Magnetaquicoccus inordinatus]